MVPQFAQPGKRQAKLLPCPDRKVLAGWPCCVPSLHPARQPALRTRPPKGVKLDSYRIRLKTAQGRERATHRRNGAEGQLGSPRIAADVCFDHKHLDAFTAWRCQSQQLFQERDRWSGGSAE